MRTLNLAEAAEVLKTHPDTVADCIANRGLPAAKIGRAWVLVLDDVIGWLRTQYITGEKVECASTNAARPERGGLTSARLEASALDAALAPRTSGPRRNSPPRLREISGGRSDSAKPRA